MLVVDTNVLVYAANAAVPEHARCCALIEELRQGTRPWCLTWGILYEFLRVSTHPRVFAEPWSSPVAWLFVEALLASPGIAILVETERHAAFVGQILRESPSIAGNLIHDVHTVALMLEHGVRRIYTQDNDFHRFSGVEIVDPLNA